MVYNGYRKTAQIAGGRSVRYPAMVIVLTAMGRTLQVAARYLYFGTLVSALHPESGVFRITKAIYTDGELKVFVSYNDVRAESCRMSGPELIEIDQQTVIVQLTTGITGGVASR